MRLNARGQRGAVIVGVRSPGPAAGRLQPGDIVTGVGGNAVGGAGELMRRIAAVPPGANVALDVIRQGRRTPITVRADRRPND
jgi:S1-C subfamily serine protease